MSEESVMQDRVLALLSGQPKPEATPSEESPPEPVQEEVSDEPTVEDIQEEQAPPPSPELEITFNGENIRLDSEKAKTYAQLGKLYETKQQEFETKFSQAAEFAKQVQAQASLQPELLDAVSEARMYQKALDQFRETDWMSLAATDPNKYLQEQARYQSIKAGADAASSKAKELQEKSQFQAQQLSQQFIQHEFEKATKAVPRWKNLDAYKQDAQTIRSYLTERGFSEQEINGFSDHRALVIAYEAAKYRQLQKAKTENLKKVQELPKVAKPGIVKSQGEVKQVREQEWRAAVDKAPTDSAKAALIQQKLTQRFRRK